MWKSLGAKGNHEDAEGIVQRCARAKVVKGLSLNKHSRIASLVAGQADLVGALGRKLGGIYDGFRAGGCYVRLAWAMAVFTPHGELLKWRLSEPAIALSDRLRSSAVTGDAPRKDGTTEAVVGELVARRQRPGISIRVERERRFKQVITALHNSAKAVGPSADDPLHFLSFAEHVSAVGPQRKFALIKGAIFCVLLKVPDYSLIENGCVRRKIFQQRSVHLLHGSTHIRPGILLIDIVMAECAFLRAHVSRGRNQRRKMGAAVFRSPWRLLTA